MIVTQLKGHTSPETAYVVADYPYGFKLRTSIRYWVEYKKGFGQRFCSQTLNPKTGLYNKPKCGAYAIVVVLGLDEVGHVVYETANWAEQTEALCAKFGIDNIRIKVAA